MSDTFFEGQQSDERILYEIHPHVYSKYIAIAKITALAIIFYIILLVIASASPMVAGLLRIGGLMLSIALVGAGFWWNSLVHSKSKTFITDRRIMRFEVVSPFYITKRALFWNEALKAKGFAPNLLYRALNIGTIVVEPQMADHENVIVTDVYYFEDLANYIDKILFMFKNKPGDISDLKPFIPKPRGHRS